MQRLALGEQRLEPVAAQAALLVGSDGRAIGAADIETITLDVYLSALAFSAGVATSSPSTALSTEMAGVITPSP